MPLTSTVRSGQCRQHRRRIHYTVRLALEPVQSVNFPSSDVSRYLICIFNTCVVNSAFFDPVPAWRSVRREGTTVDVLWRNQRDLSRGYEIIHPSQISHWPLTVLAGNANINSAWASLKSLAAAAGHPVVFMPFWTALAAETAVSSHPAVDGIGSW